MIVPLLVKITVEPIGNPDGIVNAAVEAFGAPMVTPELMTTLRVTGEVPFQTGEA